MSMVSTLAKVAAGALVARGVGKMVQGGGGAGGGLGGMLGGMLGGQGGAGGLGGMLGGQGGAQGGLGGMLGGMLGGQQQPNAQQGGGLGGMMGGAAGAGGLGGLLGGMLAGKGQQGGGIGGLLESLGGGMSPGDAQGQPPQPNSGSMGSVLNSAFENFGEPEQPPSPAQEDQAKLFLRAMIAAAKADGKIDDQEKQKILGELGDVDAEEAAFVQSELAAPLDVDGLVRDVPKGMEQQVYLMSLMGIDLDNAAEARHLDALAKGMGIPPEVCNAIHDKLGAPKLYT